MLAKLWNWLFLSSKLKINNNVWNELHQTRLNAYKVIEALQDSMSLSKLAEAKRYVGICEGIQISIDILRKNGYEI